MPPRTAQALDQLISFRRQQAQRAVDAQVIFIDIVRAPKKPFGRPRLAPIRNKIKVPKPEKIVKPVRQFKRQIVPIGLLPDPPKAPLIRPPAVYANKTYDQMVDEVLAKEI